VEEGICYHTVIPANAGMTGEEAVDLAVYSKVRLCEWKLCLVNLC